MVITIFILNTNFKMFMRHPDENVKKTVEVWDSVGRFGLKFIKCKIYLEREFHWRKGPQTKPQSIEAVME